MLMIGGAILLVLGLVSGSFLVAAPLGLLAVEPGIATWVLFPAFTLTGYLFLALASRAGAIGSLSRFAGGVLIVLALAAAIGLFLAGNALIKAPGNTMALWYVLGIGIVSGAIGLSMGESEPTRS